MRLRSSSLTLASIALLCLACTPGVLAHGGESEMEEMDAAQGGHWDGHKNEQPVEDVEYPPTYFAHPDHVALLYAHVALMVLAWVFALPVAVMLSLARSRYTLLSQLCFTVINGVGIFLATLYNAQTPDLYPNNAHHNVGWVATWLAFAQLVVTMLSRVACQTKGPTTGLATSERDVLLPITTPSHGGEEAQNYAHFRDYRLSDDEARSSGSALSRRSSSFSTMIDDEEGLPMPSPHKEYEHEEEEDELVEQHLGSSHVCGAWTKRAVSVISSRIWSYVTFAYKAVDRTILLLGFVALTTGTATLGRLFEGNAIFNGLAHWVKGGVFFWLGLFTLGRWCGSFGDLGWAWNIPPRSTSSEWRPSAEFVESGLIFFYGSTNVFLEHLGSWGEEWSAQDFEHLAITILFIGGGLCGMLIESTRIRDLLNVATSQALTNRLNSDQEEQGQEREPATYKFSINPIPALVILLLGVMMSSHHQNTMISTMVHKQWGNLLAGAAFARGLTYILVFLRPPTSILPSRPPTELLASFGLIAGGIIFMASSADTIQGMIHYNLDAMFMYTITMGFVGALMAWEIVVLAIKGLAARNERRIQVGHFQ